MLWTIIIILFVLWLLGFFGGELVQASRKLVAGFTF